MSVITAEVKNVTKGKLMDPQFELMYIDVQHEVNRLPIAELGLRDGSSAQQKFTVSDGGFFELGSEISVSVRREESAMTKLFTGIVVRHSIRMDARGSQLVIELTDKALACTLKRRSMIFRKSADSELIGKLAKESGVAVKKVENTGLKHAEMVMYDCTDWDFMLARAEANGLVLLVEGGSLSAVKPKLATAAKTFKYGIDEIYEADLQADARAQFKKVTATHYDAKKFALAKPANGADAPINPGNLQPGKVAEKVGGKELALVAPVPGLPGEFEAWAKGSMMRSRLALVCGRIRAQGDGKVKAGGTVSLKGFGKIFVGKAYVAGVRHQVSKHEWTVEIQLGLSPETLVQRAEISSPAGAGLLPAVPGLQIGIVNAFKEDPDKEFRVQVRLIGLNQKDDLVWARLALPDAGKQRGFEFRPEKGDEVIVGFLNGDPRRPIILGSLQGSAQPPFLKPEAKNKQKGIITRGKAGILFDDDKATLSMTTEVDKLNQLVILDKKGKKIEIIDKLNKNTIKLDKSGITFTCDKSVVFNVKGDFKVNAKGKANIKASKTDII